MGGNERPSDLDEFEIVSFHSTDPRRSGSGGPTTSASSFSLLPEFPNASSWIVLQDVNTGQTLTNQIAHLPGFDECLKKKSLQHMKWPDKFKGTRVMRQRQVEKPYVKYTWNGEPPSKRRRQSGGS